MAIVVELEPAVWLCDGDGDPSRTLVIENAAQYPDVKTAVAALTAARTYRPFSGAELQAVEGVVDNEPIAQ